MSCGRTTRRWPFGVMSTSSSVKACWVSRFFSANGSATKAASISPRRTRSTFAPLVPMMQHDAGLSLAQGGYLASANYVGYLAGALWAMRPARSDIAIRLALISIGVSTLAMGVTHGMAAWILWRTVAGMASAW